jgi:hypothetical protein
VDDVLEGLNDSELGGLALEIHRETERLRQCDAAELIQERKTAILRLERNQLYREANDVNATLLDVVTEDEPEHDEKLWMNALNTITSRIREIESELTDARKVGTAVWRLLTSREALGA